MPRFDEHQTDLDRLGRDIGTFAERIGAPHDASVIARTLETFHVGFRSCPVELRTATGKPGKARPEVSFRYVDPYGSHDPYQLAVAAGALARVGRPVDDLVPELQRRFPIAGYGVDATATGGIEKIWPFLKHPHPLAELAD